MNFKHIISSLLFIVISTQLTFGSDNNNEDHIIQLHAAHYKRLGTPPQLSNEGQQKFVRALETHEINNTIDHLNNILNRNNNDHVHSQFLQRLNNEMQRCKNCLPQLRKNMDKEKKELSFDPQSKPYFDALEAHCGNVEKFYEKYQGVQHHYEMYNEGRQQFCREQFYREHSQLCNDYKNIQTNILR